MLRNRCFLSKVILVFFILSIVLTSAFCICAIGHECIGKGCTICCEIDLIESCFSNLLVLVVPIVFLGGFVSFVRYLRNILFVRYRLTPVELKVKISE